MLLEVNPGDAAAAILAQAQLAILVLAVPLCAFDLCARTVRWDILLAHDPRPGFRETFRYLVVGYLVNIMLPGRLGEFVRAHLAGTRAHVGQLRALGSIVLERGLDVVVAATLGAIAARLVGIGSGVTGAFTVVAVGGWVVLLTATLVPDPVDAAAHRRLRRDLRPWPRAASWCRISAPSGTPWWTPRRRVSWPRRCCSRWSAG